jgi:hypothetical protein
LAVVVIVVLLVVPMVGAAREKRAELLDTNAKTMASQSAEIIAAGSRTCVRHLDVEQSKADVRVYPDYDVPRPPTLQATVLDHDGTVLDRASGAGYARASPLAMSVDVGRPRRDVTVCIRNTGRDGVVLAHAVLPQDGRVHLPVRVDITTRPLTTIGRIPVALTRASFFKSDIVSRPLIAVLFLAVLGLVATAIVLVLRTGRGSDGDA